MRSNTILQNLFFFPILISFFVILSPLFAGNSAIPLSFLSESKSKILFSCSSIKWKKEETEHFIITYKKRSHFTKYSKKAEKYYEKIQTDLGITTPPKQKCFVYLVPEPAIWQTFLSRIGMSQAAGFYSGNEIYFSSKRTNSYKDAEKTFAHKICHLIFMNLWNNAHCPLWLNEGMAVYQSNRVYNFPKKYIPSHYRNKSRFSLRELTSLKAYPENASDNWIFYRQCEWLIEFLNENHPQPLFQTFLRKLKQEPENFQASIMKVYGKIYKDFPTFEKKYRAFCKKQIKY